MQPSSKTNLKSLYNMFRQIPENNWHTGGNNFSVNLTAKMRGSKDIDPKIIDSLGPSIVLMAKVAHQTDTPEAFEYAILTNELPPIKLTQKEMFKFRTLTRLSSSFFIGRCYQMGQKLRVQNQSYEIFSKTVYFLDGPEAPSDQKPLN